MSEKIEVTKEELEAIKQQAVQDAKLNILIDDFQRHKNEEETRWAEMFALVRNLEKTFPERMVKCRDELENDIHLELENHYVTEKDMKLFKQDFDNKIDSINSKVRWTVGIIVSVAGVLQFVTTMVYLSYQISNLAGA